MMRSSATLETVNKWLLNRLPELVHRFGHVGFETEAKFDARFSRSSLVLNCQLAIEGRSTFVPFLFFFLFLISIHVPYIFHYFVL